ncbi:hypothetical protein, partial [Staphylococcus auricularis]|uniref:hypothetical protein n=1 Tax=Staphylococcus auricularis TaxID=29379 RepID=UPI001CD94E70
YVWLLYGMDVNFDLRFGFLGEEFREKGKEVFLRSEVLVWSGCDKGLFERMELLEFVESGSDSWFSDL